MSASEIAPTTSGRIFDFKSRSTVGDRHRLSATLDRPDELVIGKFDFVQTLRIVTNLVENALRYSWLDSEVSLSGGAENGHMVVRVADRGPGIKSHDATSAVAPLNDGLRQDGRSVSAGLGLSIARGLAVAQNGRVDYQPRPGGGSVFSLTLPLE